MSRSVVSIPGPVGGIFSLSKKFFTGLLDVSCSPLPIVDDRTVCAAFSIKTV